MLKFWIAAAVMIAAPTHAQSDTVEAPAGPTPSLPIFRPFEQQTVEDSLPSVRIVYRHGKTAAGNEYQYFKDGSGSISRPGRKSYQSEWSIQCNADAMTDARDCNLRNYDASLRLRLGSGTTIIEACVINHDFPGRRAAIRVDALPPVATMEDGCIRSPALIQQLMKGTKVTTRSVEWPYDSNIDKVTEIGPIGEAMELLRYIQINQSSFADWEK